MKLAFRARNGKRGPLEVVEGKNTRIPMYDAGEGKVLLAYYAEGRRKLVKCQSLEAGRKRAKEIIESLTSGNAHVGNFTARQTAAINDAVEILRSTNVSLTEAARQFAEAHRLLAGCGSLSDAVRCFVEERRKAELVPIKLPDLVEKFMQHIREQKKSRRYTLDMQARLHKAAETFNGSLETFVRPISIVGSWERGTSVAELRTTIAPLWPRCFPSRVRKVTCHEECRLRRNFPRDTMGEGEKSAFTRRRS
jgi:hypothetical protein